jgi:hypothetical protein
MEHARRARRNLWQDHLVDAATLCFGLFMIFSAFYVVLEITWPFLGISAGLVASAAFMGALKIVSNSPAFRLIDAKRALRAEEAARREAERRGQQLWSRPLSHLPKDSAADKVPTHGDPPLCMHTSGWVCSGSSCSSSVSPETSDRPVPRVPDRSVWE